jgi:hypothetical protein
MRSVPHRQMYSHGCYTHGLYSQYQSSHIRAFHSARIAVHTMECSMRIRLAVVLLAVLSSGCILPGVIAVAGSTAAGVAISKGVSDPIMSLRSGKVVLDSLTWSKAPDDSTKLVVRGIMTWKKAKMGPQNKPYLNLDAISALSTGDHGVSGYFQVDFLDTKDKLMMSATKSKLTVWDGKDAITVLQVDKPFHFEMCTMPVAWNVLRDAKSKNLHFIVAAL